MLAYYDQSFIKAFNKARSRQKETIDIYKQGTSEFLFTLLLTLHLYPSSTLEKVQTTIIANANKIKDKGYKDARLIAIIYNTKLRLTIKDIPSLKSVFNKELNT